MLRSYCITNGCYMRRITISVPDSLVDDLEAISARLGFSKSATITAIMTDPMRMLADLLGGLPLDATSGDVRRFKGQSINVVQNLVSQLQSQLGEDSPKGGD